MSEYFLKTVKVKPISKTHPDFVSFATLNKDLVIHIREGCEERYVCLDYPKELMGQQLGSRLKNRRIQLGLTQQDLSAQSGVTQGMIATIEAEKADPGRKIILKLKKYLGVDMNFFDE